jgi:hypothetical protein
LTIFLVIAKDILNERTEKGTRLTTLLKHRLEYIGLYTDLFLFEHQNPIALLRKVINTCYEKLIGPNSRLIDQQFMLDKILKLMFPICVDISLN